jgi:uncharacterized protein (DUF2235 family)
VTGLVAPPKPFGKPLRTALFAPRLKSSARDKFQRYVAESVGMALVSTTNSERAPMSNPKRLALFLDGTWNTLDDDTNVWRLKALCTVDADQSCYYSAGVGTAYGESLKGGMFGWGLDDEVMRAYQWLVEHYTAGARLFIFGFSRGAYTARSLSGFISKCGLLKPGSPISLKQLYARYRKGSTIRTIRELKNVPDGELSFEDKWLKEYAMPVPIWFQGVWDTVGALGVPFGNIPVISRSNYGFLEVDLRINNSRAYHALAIDEHREAFSATLWTKSVEKDSDTHPPRSVSDVEQRWFVGAHADVGGGYENGLLAQVPLKWLMGKAQLHGLNFNDTVVIDGDESLAKIHDSFGEMAHGAYCAAKFWHPYYRPIGAPSILNGNKTTSTINETIDSTVFDRWRVDQKYRPANLVAWSRRHNVDIASLQGSVRADDPTVAIEPDQMLAAH